MYNFFVDFVAGCFGGAFGILVGHPFDTVKTWQQKLNVGVGRSILEILVRYDGRLLKGLYKGMHFPLISNGAVNSVVFSVYGYHLRQLEQNISEDVRTRRRQKNIFLAGMVAGFVQAYLVCPVELIKIRIQTLSFRGSSWDCMKNIFQREGLNGFYRGITPTLLRDVLPYGLYMLTYEKIVEKVVHMGLFDKYDSSFKNNNNSLIVFAGAAAGLVSWLFVVPFDVVKTKMQIETNPNKHPTMIECAKEVFKAGGLKALIRGTKMIMLRSIPMNAFTFWGYEKCKLLLYASQQTVQDNRNVTRWY